MIVPTLTRTSQRRSAIPRKGLLASPARNLILGGIYMAVVMSIATTSYVAAGWSVWDALYMVIITVYTVGFDEVRPIDTVLLRTITISNIILGCTGVIFLTGALVQFITLNQINQVLGLKRMNSQIDKLTGHVIVCGFGRIGVQLAQELEAGRAAFVVLEREEARAAEVRALGYLCLQGDATEEATLLAAGVLRANTLATVLPNDAANVFITLSARSLNPALEIIARGDAPSTERKLVQAGANSVVLPTHIGAERIAEMILYRETARFIRGSEHMVDFERVLRGLGLNMDMVTAAAGSPAAGQTIEWLEQEARGAFFVVQINRSGGEAITHPDPASRIESGDGLVLIGRFLGARTLFEAGARPGFRLSVR
ncbi:TrkA family potassium uptake protein [Acidisphaera sp. L21]|uniref:potassium channel family protein n=1 Tax=Acidisphaera sp. L21 TaxID=1641851 RepID=UPI0020B13227|nr:potassium channel protein [Acidisphaera sp. L21]